MNEAEKRKQYIEEQKRIYAMLLAKNPLLSKLQKRFDLRLDLEQFDNRKHRHG